MKAAVFGAGDIRTNERWREQKRPRPVDVIVLLGNSTNSAKNAEHAAQTDTSISWNRSHRSVPAIGSQGVFKPDRIAPDWIAVDLKPVN